MVKKVCLLLMTLFICAEFNFANSKRQHVSNVCTYDQQTDVVIKFKESKRKGAKLLGAVSTDNLDNCQENCCQHNGCTVALFHSTNATENCYFIRCFPYDVCTFTTLSNFSISTVSLDNEASDISEKEEEYDTVTWPNWWFDEENEAVATTPVSEPSTSDQLHSTPISSDLTPESLPHSPTSETVEDNSTATSLAQTSSSTTSSLIEQTHSSSSNTTLSLSETSSNSVPAESSPTPTLNFPSISLNNTGVSSSMVNTPIAGESSSVNVTDTGIWTTLKNDVQQTTDAPDITTTSYIPTTTELLTEPTTQQQHTTTKTSTTEGNQVVDGTATESHTTTRIYVDVTEMIMDTGDTTIMQEPVNATANPLTKHDATSTYNKLSSNGALIASLCFSVLFACAVCVLLGKRWYEGYQRRHYSKVDYLINGMYN
ncbi:uncharacterized protein C11orf24 homolog isoform X1 [Anneissia japonica]|uniref:uncharacterized protein C11orf24 homolog isoform X1 n=1 Tax=Anneissia japonica TaxID=1529436 RepID=UPI0014255A8B|nr:uncharacterized protein C11orf24 homolog isoform X1 [Anneissia japonica]